MEQRNGTGQGLLAHLVCLRPLSGSCLLGRPYGIEWHSERGSIAEGFMKRTNTVLVTGASSGLGLALSQRLLKTPHHLVLTARAASMGRFAEAGIRPGERLWLRTLDIACPEQREAVVAEIDRELGGVDVLINNAGVSFRAVVEHVRDVDRREQMEINFHAPMELVRLVLPSMRSRRAGRIINISSVGGMMAMPTMAAYSASKWALEGATEALFYEVRPWNIHVTLAQPGFVHSASFQKVRGTEQSDRARTDPSDPYYEHYHRMEPFIARLMNLTWATPERIARRVVKVMEARRPPLRVPVTPDARLFYLMRRWLPRNLYHWVLYRSLPHIRTWGPGLSGEEAAHSSNE